MVLFAMPTAVALSHAPVFLVGDVPDLQGWFEKLFLLGN